MSYNSERIVLLTDMKDHLSYAHLAKIYKEEGNKKEDESVSQNLMMHGYKNCNSCKISKTIFPV